MLIWMVSTFSDVLRRPFDAISEACVVTPSRTYTHNPQRISSSIMIRYGIGFLQRPEVGPRRLVRLRYPQREIWVYSDVGVIFGDGPGVVIGA